jgi:hypothetical protein
MIRCTPSLNFTFAMHGDGVTLPGHSRGRHPSTNYYYDRYLFASFGPNAVHYYDKIQSKMGKMQETFA